mgnify:CR=1 FL=1
MTLQINPTHSFTYDGAQLNVYHANKGEGLPKHEHAYSHLTICHSGSCIVRKEGKEMIFDKETKPINLVENEWDSYLNSTWDDVRKFEVSQLMNLHLTQRDRKLIIRQL